jgi:hypothetical protein
LTREVDGTMEKWNNAREANIPAFHFFKIGE